MDFRNSSQKSTNLNTRNKRKVRKTVIEDNAEFSPPVPPLIAIIKAPNQSKNTTTASN
jgi:hypothetical protein